MSNNKIGDIVATLQSRNKSANIRGDGQKESQISVRVSDRETGDSFNKGQNVTQKKRHRSWEY